MINANEIPKNVKLKISQRIFIPYFKPDIKFIKFLNIIMTVFSIITMLEIYFNAGCCQCGVIK